VGFQELEPQFTNKMKVEKKIEEERSPAQPVPIWRRRQILWIIH